MLEVAGVRVAEHGWDNVHLVATPFAQAPIHLVGFDQPWRLLAGFVPDLQVTELGTGAGYLAVGHARGRSTPPRQQCGGQ